MPIYEFECDNTDGCESNLRYEKEIPLALPHTYDCPICGSPMRKIYSSVPVHFKTGGFYSTDK